MVYFLLIIGLLILTYSYDYRGKTQGKLFWLLVCLLAFILIAGLRYRLGTDSIRYERYFINGPKLETLGARHFINTRFSPLYILLSAGVRTVTSQFLVFQIVHAIIVNCVIFYFLYLNTKKIFFALILYFLLLYFTLNMEVLREALAVCVFLLAWPSFRDGKWVKWYLLSVIGFLCHTSAVFMFILPIIVLPGIKSLFIYGNRTWIICGIILLVVMFIKEKFFVYIQALAVMENVSERAQVYSKTDLASSNLNIFGYVVAVIRFVIYPLLALYFLNKKSDDKFWENSRLVNFILVSVYIGIVMTGIPIFYRYNNYFLFFPIIVYSEIIFSNLEVNSGRIRLKFVTWILIFIPFFYSHIQPVYFKGVNSTESLKGYMNYYPYASRFDMEKDENREKLFRYRKAY